MYYDYILTIFLITFVSTGMLTIITRFLGKRGLLGNLYESVRGGTPRALGIVPFIMLGIFLPSGFNDLVLIIGFFALFDDIIGRRKIGSFQMEWGQLLRGVGMIAVMIVGFPLVGYASILIALLIQPINISDMQPGSTCSVVMIMAGVSILAILLGTALSFELPTYYYVPVFVLVICLAYAPLDYLGKIMLGEVGNHSFAIALGLCFYAVGGFWWTLLMFFLTTALIAFIRKNSLKEFFARNLKLSNPAPGDYFMDVLTGGGLGDMFRKIFLRKKQIKVKSPLFMFLGFRRLLFNPFAIGYQQPRIPKKPKSNLLNKK